MKYKSKVKVTSICLLSVIFLNQFGGMVHAAEISTNDKYVSTSENKSTESSVTKDKTTSTSQSSSIEKSSSSEIPDTVSTSEKQSSTSSSLEIKNNEENKKKFQDNKATATTPTTDQNISPIGDNDPPLPEYTGTWGTSPWTYNIGAGILTVEAGELDSIKEAPWNLYMDIDQNINEIIFDGKVVAPEDSRILFKGLHLTSLDLSNLDTSKVTDMSYMFYDMPNLTSLDLSSFDTSKVTDMNRMFYDMPNLTSLDLSNFDTSKVTNMDYMFYDMSSLTSLDLSNFDTSKVIEMADMFAGLTSLDKISLGQNFRFQSEAKFPASSTSGNWTRENGESKAYSATDFMTNYGTGDLTAGTYVGSNFWGTSPWEFDSSTGTLTIGSGDLSGYKDSPWNRTDDAKIDITKIKKIVLDGKIVAPQDSSYLFGTSSGRSTVESIDGLSNLDTSKVTNMASMFINIGKLITSLDVSNFDTSNVTNMSDMFHNLFGLTSLNVSNFDTSNVTNMGSMFQNLGSLTSLDVSNFDTSNVTDMSYMFSNLASLTSLNVSNFDTSNVTDMSHMFSSLSSLNKIELGQNFRFQTNAGLSNPSNASAWIREDRKSKGYNATDFMANYGTGDLTAGTYVGTNFWGTSPWEFDEDSGTLTIGSGELSSYKDSPWNRTDDAKIDPTKIKKIVLDGKVIAPENSYRLFCTTNITDSLKSIQTIEGLPNLDTSQATTMEFMFMGLTSVASLDLSSFDTSKVTTMANMFYADRNLQNLDLSSFDTSKVTTMANMFYALTSLDKISLSQNFKFQTEADFPKSATTGNWTREDGKSKAYSATDFMANYGTGDLTAGTYIPEPIASTLQLTTEFDKENYTIGDKINTTLTIKATEDSPEGSVANNIKLTNLDKFTLEGAQVLPKNVVVETYDSNNTLIDSKEQAISESMALPDLENGQYIKIKIEGEAWNNTDDSTETNYNIGLENNATSSENYTGKVSVQSGNLEFKDIPENLDFNSVMLSGKNKETLIDRQDKDWTINISDMRGTTPHGDTKEVDRQNWRMYVSADEFKDDSGTSIPYSTLSTTFVKNGEITELNNDETMVENHDVTNETPELNHLLGLKWGESEGFKAILHDNTKLSHDKNYSADMTFELRIEP